MYDSLYLQLHSIRTTWKYGYKLTNPYGMGRQVARLLMSTWTWTDFPSCMMCQPNLNNIDLWISLFIFIIYFSFLFAILILLFSVKCLTTFERKTSQHNNVEIVQLLKNNKENNQNNWKWYTVYFDWRWRLENIMAVVHICPFHF